jgi:hypothetical protein
MKNKSRSIRNSVTRNVSKNEKSEFVVAEITILEPAPCMCVQLEIPDLLPIQDIASCKKSRIRSAVKGKSSKKRKAPAVIDPRQLKLIFVEECNPIYEV